MRTLLLFFSIAVLASGCASTRGIRKTKDWETRGAESDRRLLIGKWFGESPVQEGGRKTWLMDRSGDGTFVVRFKNLTPSGKIEDESEYGDWGVSGDIYFTITRGWIRGGQKEPVHVRRSYFDDAYVVQKLTAEEFVYKSAADGDVYTVKKVPDNFTMP